METEEALIAQILDLGTTRKFLDRQEAVLRAELEAVRRQNRLDALNANPFVRAVEERVVTWSGIPFLSPERLDGGFRGFDERVKEVQKGVYAEAD